MAVLSPDAAVPEPPPRPSRPFDERRVHRWLARRGVPRGLSGSAMHDAAALAPLARGGKAVLPVVCVDQCLEGVHFTEETKAALVGRKAANRALSDLAATAARPRAVLLALHVPPGCPEARVIGMIRGVEAAARAVGADLVAGDLAVAPGPLGLAVTALGAFDAARGARPPGRDRATPGQVVLLTGPVGGSLLGRHLTFRPRVALGRALARAGATALMDVSDGLALDLDRLARASGAVVTLALDAVPVHRDATRRARETGRSAREHALADGEDHELLATLPRRAAEAFVAAFARSRPARDWSSRGAAPRIVGRVERRARRASEAGVWLVEGARRERLGPGTGGYVHGA